MEINLQSQTPPSKVFTDRGGSKYDEAIEYGIKFAPFELAVKFAYENPCFEYDENHWDQFISFDPNKHFGWHGSQFANKAQLLSLKYQ